jgi:hypothetical protein
MFGPLLALALHAGPTAAPGPTPPEPVQDYRVRYRRTQLGGMSLLTGFAVVNIGWGLGGALTTDGVTQYVHEMNATWNTVNLALGITGLVTNRKLKDVSTRSEAHKLYRRTLRTYAINNGLDVLYMSTGTFLFALGKGRGWDRVEGYGISIIAQGGFLFLFDLGMLIAHERTAANVPNLSLVPSVTRRTSTLSLAGRF